MKEQIDHRSFIHFVPAEGSAAGGKPTSKERRIREAVADLELAIAGCEAQCKDPTKPKPRWDVQIDEGQGNYRFRFAGGLEAFAVAPQPDLNHTENVDSTLALRSLAQKYFHRRISSSLKGLD